jgi:hypothetical protein
MANIRPSCPDPSTPMTAPGRIGRRSAPLGMRREFSIAAARVKRGMQVQCAAGFAENLMRFHRFAYAALTLGVIWMALPASHSSAAEKLPKKLIEFGWDEPDTAFMLKHVAEMEGTPFDGCVFHLKGDFLWQTWGDRAFEEADVRQPVEDLKATPFKRLTHNFLRLNMAPGKLDWFDDHAAILKNVRLMARAARDGRCKGILFDTEQYDTALFDFAKQRDAKTKSWDVYAAQARLRGREVMAAFQEGYPDLTIFLTFGYSLPREESGGDRAKLPKVHYGLMAPFMDGMVDAAKGGTRIVDGYELSYGYKDTTRFARGYEAMATGVLPFIGADPKRYREVFSFGFGVWMDYDWRKKGWDAADPSKNFYTPEAFEKTVRTALQTADEYVWIYTEQPRWWTAKGKTEKLPAAYDQALRRVKE